MQIYAQRICKVVVKSNNLQLTADRSCEFYRFSFVASFSAISARYIQLIVPKIAVKSQPADLPQSRSRFLFRFRQRKWHGARRPEFFSDLLETCWPTDRPTRERRTSPAKLRLLSSLVLSDADGRTDGRTDVHRRKLVKHNILLPCRCRSGTASGDAQLLPKSIVAVVAILLVVAISIISGDTDQTRMQTQH